MVSLGVTNLKIRNLWIGKWNINGCEFGGYDLRDSTYAHLKMNGDATDSMGNLSPGAEGGTTTFVSGKIGEAVRTLNYPDLINLSSGLDNVFFTSSSFNFWLKPEGGNDAYFGSDVFHLTASGSEYSFYYESDGSPVTVNGGDITGSDWRMITVTCEEVNGTTMRVRLYQDSVEVGDSGNVTITMSAYTSGSMYISAIGPGSPAGSHHGDFDSFSFHTKVLTETEILGLYQNGSGTEEIYGCLPDPGLFPSSSSSSLSSSSSSSLSSSSSSSSSDSSQSSASSVEPCSSPCDIDIQFRTYTLEDRLLVYENFNPVPTLDTGYISTGGSFDPFPLFGLECPVTICIETDTPGTAWDLIARGCGLNINTSGGYSADLQCFGPLSSSSSQSSSSSSSLSSSSSSSISSSSSSSLSSSSSSSISSSSSSSISSSSSSSISSSSSSSISSSSSSSISSSSSSDGYGSYATAGALFFDMLATEEELKLTYEEFVEKRVNNFYEDNPTIFNGKTIEEKEEIILKLVGEGDLFADVAIEIANREGLDV